MGESAVLVHSYSFAAPVSRNDSHEEKTINALSESISFGKFMTENLEWGKWSSFSHRKYVEEAEKYSRPGSVAQKKAFFEAHYKRIAEAKKAAAAEVTPAQLLLHTLEETQPPPLSKLQQEVQEQVPQQEFLQIGYEEKEKKQEQDSCVGEKEQTRRSLTRNRPVFRLSLEKTIPPNASETEISLSEKQSERPTTSSSEIEEEQLVHRQSFSLLNCFMGNAKTQDQNQSRKKRKTEKKKQKKQFLCLFLKPKSARE